MLQKLSINNYALIESSETDFFPGLSVITGETGAGKSIMLSALQLLLGERADSKSMRDKTKKTVIEAEFIASSKSLKPFFEENELEWNDDSLIVRREILPGGRSRAFVNDTPVKLSVLDDISSSLIDIHSQHLSIKLLNKKNQLEIVDSISGADEEAEAYKSAYYKYISIRKNLEQLRQLLLETKKDNEYVRFQLDTIGKLKLKRGEAAALEAKYDLLSNASNIKESFENASGQLSGEESSALSRISSARSSLSAIDFSLLENSQEDNLLSRLESVYIELKDIAESVEKISEEINDDSNVLEKTSDRLNKIYSLQKRFHLEDADKLVDLYEELKKKVLDEDTLPEKIKALSHEMKETGELMKQTAEKLTHKRKEGSQILSQKVTEVCRDLGLPNFKLEVCITPGKYNSTGADNIGFLCSFNKNQELRPIEEIASGGELSRVMLGLKYIIAQKISLPTIIFDEIDTGVSGEIADRMGRMMREMGKEMQVISITHLPQIASKGEHHYKVYKKDNQESTLSHIEVLDSQQRIRELAVMLSGREIDDAALRNAESLLKQI